MIHRDSPRTGGLTAGQRRRLAWLARLTMAIALLAAVAGPMARSAAAQESAVEDNTYTSPDYDWSIEWDEDFYVPADDFGGFELVLWGESSTIFFQTLENVEDAEECLDIQTDALSGEDGVEDFELLEDEDGNEFEERDPEHSFAAYSLVYTGSDGEAQDRVNMVDCYVLEEGESALSIILITFPEAFADEAEAYDDLVASLELPGGSASDEDDSDSRSSRDEDEEETPEADDETPEADDEDSSASRDQDEEETPEADDSDSRSSRDEDEEETPEASDEEELELEGVTGNTYESPSFGYTLEWDEDIWFVLLSISDPQDDFLALMGSNGLTMFVWGMTEYDEDIVDCFEGTGEEIASREGVENVELLTNDDGVGMHEAEDGTWVAGFYTYEQEGEVMASYVQCITLEGEGAVIQVEAMGTMEAMQENVASIDEVLATLELP